MKSKAATLLAVIVFILAGQSSFAQGESNNFKSQFLGQFNYTARVLELAKAMPAESYDWRPMEGVRSVGEVYKHIAASNFGALTSLDIPVPGDVNMDGIESLSGKEEIVSILERSIEHVKSSVGEMPTTKLSEQTEMYGRETTGQGVLLMIATHMSEHVGQSIAYARMNKVVPPWSR